MVVHIAIWGEVKWILCCLWCFIILLTGKRRSYALHNEFTVINFLINISIIILCWTRTRTTLCVFCVCFDTLFHLLIRLLNIKSRLTIISNNVTWKVSLMSVWKKKKKTILSRNYSQIFEDSLSNVHTRFTHLRVSYVTDLTPFIGIIITNSAINMCINNIFTDFDNMHMMRHVR